MYKKILILSASSGAGHVRAADALVKAFRASAKVQEIVHLDTLEYTSKAVRTLYTKAYFEMAKSAPDVLGWMYGLLDKPLRNEKKMRALERLNVSLFMRVLRRIQPDLVVSTHFLPADIIEELRRREHVRCRSAVVITDFDAHAMWLNKDVDRYFTACQEAKVYLERIGMDASRVVASGIPIDPVFSQTRDVKQTRMDLGLDPAVPMVLLSAGGLGVLNMSELLRSLVSITSPVQIVAVCGKNEQLKREVEEVAHELHARLPIHAVGFTTRMDEYMSAADLIVTKPGGLTSSEALAKGLAMIVVQPIRGQEERNSDYLLENGVALKCNNLATLSYKIELLLADPDRLQRMKTRALSIAKPFAAQTIVDSVLSDMP